MPGTIGRVTTDVTLADHQADLGFQLKVVGQRLKETMQQAGNGVGPEPPVKECLLRIEAGHSLKLGNHLLQVGYGWQGADKRIVLIFW